MIIEHFGSGVIETYKNDVLVLNEMLHVPAITKNLISVSRLTSDNNVIVEFSSSDCFVKDKVTRRKVLHGTLKEGLYQFEPDKDTRVDQRSRSQSHSQPNTFSVFSSVVKNLYYLPRKCQMYCLLKTGGIES